MAKNSSFIQSLLIREVFPLKKSWTIVENIGSGLKILVQFSVLVVLVGNLVFHNYICIYSVNEKPLGENAVLPYTETKKPEHPLIFG